MLSARDDEETDDLWTAWLKKEKRIFDQATEDALVKKIFDHSQDDGRYLVLPCG